MRTSAGVYSAICIYTRTRLAENERSLSSAQENTRGLRGKLARQTLCMCTKTREIPQIDRERERWRESCILSLLPSLVGDSTICTQ